MAYLFVPPTVDEGPMGGNWLFARYTRKQGVTVLKIDGEYYEDRFPIQDDIAIAEYVYMGGHEYYITQEEKDDLEAAGYEVFTV
jgi:hypothetical protein